jgi:hypothetical protein
MEPDLLLPDLAHAVTPAGSHGHEVLSLGMSAVVLTTAYPSEPHGAGHTASAPHH